MGKKFTNLVADFCFVMAGLFFGEQLLKLSADLCTGSAGILLVMERYRKLVDENRLTPSSMFYLDDELNLMREVIYEII